MPGPNERSQRPTSSAYPSSSFAAGGTSPSQSDMSVHRGLESRQWPVFSPRTSAPSTASWLSTRDAIGTFTP